MIIDQKRQELEELREWKRSVMELEAAQNKVKDEIMSLLPAKYLGWDIMEAAKDCVQELRRFNKALWYAALRYCSLNFECSVEKVNSAQVREQFNVFMHLANTSQEGKRHWLMLSKIPRIVVFCGSTKFIETMAIKAWEYEKQGYVTLSCHFLPKWYCPQPDHKAETDGVKDLMDELHLRKIDMADEVFVVNVGGYIGESTRNEIAYAQAQGKTITYLEEPCDNLADAKPAVSQSNESPSDGVSDASAQSCDTINTSPQKPDSSTETAEALRITEAQE